MQRSWRNLYKRTNVFFCSHRLHKHSERGTSVWHILKYKKCHPDGCLTFSWHCLKFDQKHKCHRGKKHVGKDCFSCKFFYDEKNQFQPDVKLTETDYNKFEQEFMEFEEWASELTLKRIEVRGKVSSIQPFLVKTSARTSQAINCRGVLLYFKNGIFKYDLFEDPFYARLSFNAYDRWKIAEGDEIDFEGELIIDRGRFVFKRLSSVEIVNEGENDYLPSNDISRKQYEGSFVDGQPAKCLNCVNGILIDDLNSDGRSHPRRLLYCLQGVADYRFCPYRESY